MPTDEIERVAAPARKNVRARSDLPAVWGERDIFPGRKPTAQMASGPVPQVSVVIPTRGRAVLAERAVRSVLAQSFHDFEIVVVIDGPDPETKEAIQQLEDKRLRILHLTEKVGGSEARNIGVRFARGKWIALLDDDDEWLPDKLAKQWNTGESLGARYVFVASRFIERTEDADRVLPRRMPALGELFSDYHIRAARMALRGRLSADVDVVCLARADDQSAVYPRT